MKLIYHFIASLTLIIALLPFFGSISWYIIIGGFFVDIDHYFRYIFVYKDISIKNAFLHHKKVKRPPNPRFLLFHSVELLILFAFVSFYNNIIMMITLGLSVHIFIDFIDATKQNLIQYREWSIINYIRKRLTNF